MKEARYFQPDGSEVKVFAESIGKTGRFNLFAADDEGKPIKGEDDKPVLVVGNCEQGARPGACLVKGDEPKDPVDEAAKVEARAESQKRNTHIR